MDILKKVVQVGRSLGIIIPFHKFNNFKGITPKDHVNVTYTDKDGKIIISRIDIIKK